MTDTRKKRMSLLDNIAAAGSPAPAQSMMTTNRALRSARDAVDSHRVWELDPASIDDTRFTDRLDPKDVADLRASIQANGQAVPILVRRDPAREGRYLLVYGRRRLEAIRGSDAVHKIRALIASMDDTAALRAQVTENTARRDLSYIERALFAQELLDSGFGNQSQVAEVLNTTKSTISMALNVARAIGPELARAIGPAHGIGRPRWEALVEAMAADTTEPAELILIAHTAYAASSQEEGSDNIDPSADAFRAVCKAVTQQRPRAAKTETNPQSATKSLHLDGRNIGRLARTSKGLRLDLQSKDNDFLSWIETSAQDVIEDLHRRWLSQSGRK